MHSIVQWKRRSRLFKMAAVILRLLVQYPFGGYFGMKKPLNMTFTASLLAMAVVVSLIPFLTKKHSIQSIYSYLCT